MMPITFKIGIIHKFCGCGVDMSDWMGGEISKKLSDGVVAERNQFSLHLYLSIINHSACFL